MDPLGLPTAFTDQGDNIGNFNRAPADGGDLSVQPQAASCFAA